MGYAKVIYEDEPLIDLTADTVNSPSVLSGKTFHDYKGDVLTGTMTNHGSGSASISTKAQTVSLSNGYYDGTGSVSIASAEQAKIIAENIKKDVTILGVTGTHEGGSYEEEDLSTGGFWAKINYAGSPYPDVPEPSQRQSMTPYVQSISNNHCNVYIKNPTTGEWDSKVWNDTNVSSYMVNDASNEEFYRRVNFKIVPDPGWRIDPTSIPFYGEFDAADYGCVYAGAYPSYRDDTTGAFTAFGEIIDIDSDGNGYAAVCLPISVEAGNRYIDIYFKATL